MNLSARRKLQLTSLSILMTVAFSTCGNFSAIIKAASTQAPQTQQTNDKVELFWIGHATVLIHLYDKWIFTDPNFSMSTGTVIRRLTEPGIEIDSIRPVDAILISHNHFDHLDRPSLKKLRNSKHLFVPVGGLTYIPENTARQLHGVVPGETYEEDGLKITAVPVQHFGGRWLVDNLWDGEAYTGYVIEYRGIIIFFAGDTGYNATLFKELKKNYQIDIALIPVGPVGGLMSGGLGNSVHVNPYGGVKIFKDCGARYMIPIHHSTFYRRGGSEKDMMVKAFAQAPEPKNILTLEAGESAQFERTLSGTLQVK